MVAVELSGRTSRRAKSPEAKALTLLPAQELLEKGFALLSFRFLRLTIPIGALAIGSSTGKTFSSGRLVGNLSADAGKIVRKRPVAESFAHQGKHVLSFDHGAERKVGVAAHRAAIRMNRSSSTMDRWASAT